MSEGRKQKIRLDVADAEPIVFSIEPSEEPIYRKANAHVNNMWQKWFADQPTKGSHYALAKVALAFAELYYRKAEQLERQTKVLGDFEKELDSILLKMED